MMGMLRRLSLTAASVGILAAGARGADDVPREPPPSAIHLVGHEDTALLQRVQDVIDDWDPRKLRNPYVLSVTGEGPGGKPVVRKVPRRPDLNEFIADYEAAEALGKAFFWEMQAGSDFRRQGGKFVGTACASCHFRFGADPRNGFTTRIPYVAWDRYKLDPDHELEFNERQVPFRVEEKAKEVIANVTSLHTPRPVGLPTPDRTEVDAEEEDDDAPRTPLSLIVGSQGVEPLVFKGLRHLDDTPAWASEKSDRRKVAGYLHYKPDWSMFIQGQDDSLRAFRQITARNSPTVVNSGFSDRLFHDGRAESTFNGFSIFGDIDEREVIHIRGPRGTLMPVRVAISHAALASQAVGPIVNEVEMSYLGRSFHDLAAKLLGAPVLGYQTVADDDSHLAQFKAQGLVGPTSTYRSLIRRAFRSELWDGSKAGGGEQLVDLVLASVAPGAAPPKGTLMEANFSLYWGLSILLYEASLVSNDSPFDRMMRGDGRAVSKLWEDKKRTLAPIFLDRVRTPNPRPTGSPQSGLASGTEVFQRGLRIFMDRGCIDCHSGPLFSELFAREENAEPKPPIGHTLERVLLPNSQGDAIDIMIRARHDAALGATVAVLDQFAPAKKPIAGRLALEMELLRDRARGKEKNLTDLVADRLVRAGYPADPTKKAAGLIAEIWLGFEKTAATFAGGRPFFGEDERVASAALLVDPVLVEKMVIPLAQIEQRRPLPIRGPLANQNYAFYDLAFYNIGVAPPRYDRGIGFSDSLPEGDPDQVTDAIVAEVVQATEGVHKNIREKLDKTINLAGAEGKALLRIRVRAEAARELPGLDPAEYQALSLRLASRQARPGANRIQAASGVSGSAYRFNPLWKRRPMDVARDRAPTTAATPAEPPGQARVVSTFDDPASTKNPRDLSWFRDMATWDRNFAPAGPTTPTTPPATPYDSVDERRADAHFYSRARALVQNELPWGHRKPFLHDNELAFWGAFKTPSLRNVELTPPYMHNGRLQTLFDVLDFYDRGGDLPAHREVNPDKHPAIVKLDLSEDDKFAVVFFLMCLTDDRVRREMGPFDHPSIRVVNGYDDALNERIIEVRPIGSGGVADGMAQPSFPAGN